MGDAIIVSGAPGVTALNGTFYLLDPAATGTSRLWGNTAQMRVYYENGWKLGNPTDGTVYFRQSIPQEIDPWDIPQDGFATDIDAYTAYTNSLSIVRTDDEETSTVVLGTTKSYVLTSDAAFMAGKEYFTRVGSGTDSNPYSYFLATVTVGMPIPSNTYFEEINVTTETTTTVNPRTNSVRTSITEKRVSVFPVQEVHERYSVPNLSAGKVYRFSFINDFRDLGYIPPQEGDFEDEETLEKDSDITKGVFRVVEQTTLYSLILGGIDVYQNLYLPLGLSKDVYEQDRATWTNDDVWYKLMNPMLPAQVLYVPISIIDGVPDGNIQEYKRYHLITDIGLYHDPDMLADLVTSINLLFQGRYGIPTAAKLASYDSVWIPEAYYNWFEARRKSSRRSFMETDGERYYKTLFADKYNELSAKVRQYESDNLALQETIDQMTSNTGN